MVKLAKSQTIFHWLFCAEHIANYGHAHSQSDLILQVMFVRFVASSRIAYHDEWNFLRFAYENTNRERKRENKFECEINI